MNTPRELIDQYASQTGARGNGLRAIARKLQVAPSTVMRWYRGSPCPHIALLALQSLVESASAPSPEAMPDVTQQARCNYIADVRLTAAEVIRLMGLIPKKPKPERKQMSYLVVAEEEWAEIWWKLDRAVSKAWSDPGLPEKRSKDKPISGS